MSTRWLDDDEMVAWVRLAAVLELLPEDQRSVVVLRVVADLSVRQTAAAIGREE
mgnify:CR=1 FL=1